MTPVRSGRIPEDLPFVVRTSRSKFRMWIGSTVLAGVILSWCVLGPILYLLADSLHAGASGTAAVVVGPLLIIAGVLAIPYLALRAWFIGRGPLLAADRAGVWGRAEKVLQGQPVWLPWPAVAAVTSTRRGFEDLVFIDPDPRAGYAPPGTRLVVTTLMADHTAAAIIAELNRCAGQVPPP